MPSNQMLFYFDCMTGNLKGITELSKCKDVDPSADGNKAVIWTAERGHLEVVKYLLTLDCVRKSYIRSNNG